MTSISPSKLDNQYIFISTFSCACVCLYQYPKYNFSQVPLTLCYPGDEFVWKSVCVLYIASYARLFFKQRWSVCMLICTDFELYDSSTHGSKCLGMGQGCCSWCLFHSPIDPCLLFRFFTTRLLLTFHHLK